MKLIFSTLIFVMLMSMMSIASSEEDLKQSIQKIAKELEDKYSGKAKTKVAILQFRTNDNRITPFNQYIQDVFNQSFRSSNRFEIVDQNAINRVVDAFGWDLSMSNEFRQYSDLSEQIFRSLGVVPNIFIYGQINDNDHTINITGYLIPNGIKSTNIYSTQVVKSSAVTDKLLGKPIRKPEKKPEPQKEIVVVEKEVIVEKPVYIEKEVIVEKPVYIEKPAEEPSPEPKGDYTGKVGEMEFKLLEAKSLGDRVEVTIVVVNNTMDDRINYIESRFFDTNGNEFTSNSYGNTFRNRDLIEAVPIKGTITFKGDNIQRTQSMSVIEISVYGTGSKLLGTLRFRNVPVTN